MTTRTAPVSGEAEIINFHSFQKASDWRYQSYEHLSPARSSKQGAPRETTIHWIGIIDLEQVRESRKTYPVAFWDGTETVIDTAWNRDVDGASLGGSTPYSYDLSKLLPDLLKHRAAGQKYFQIFLEETVDYLGGHTVSLLYDADDPIMYGTATTEQWFNEPAMKWVGCSCITKHDKLEKLPLLSHRSYNWLK